MIRLSRVPIAAPFGGYLMCHGAGDIAGHVRFGARDAAAPVGAPLAVAAMQPERQTALSTLQSDPAPATGRRKEHAFHTPTGAVHYMTEDGHYQQHPVPSCSGGGFRVDRS